MPAKMAHLVRATGLWLWLVTAELAGLDSPLRGFGAIRFRLCSLGWSWHWVTLALTGNPSGKKEQIACMEMKIQTQSAKKIAPDSFASKLNQMGPDKISNSQFDVVSLNVGNFVTKLCYPKKLDYLRSGVAKKHFSSLLCVPKCWKMYYKVLLSQDVRLPKIRFGKNTCLTSTF